MQEEGMEHPSGSGGDLQADVPLHGAQQHPVNQPLPAHLNMTTRTSCMMIIFGKPLQVKLPHRGEQLSLRCIKFTPPWGA